jgi:glycosyltransferase involved in cell wall biosynthesis
MKLGFGVSEAVAELCRWMEPLGVVAVVGVLGEDRRYPDLDIRRVRPYAADIADVAAQVGATVVVAHGSPYFEVLPALRGRLGTVAYEYGDPTPEMFDDDARARRVIADNKRSQVYPAVDAVASISRFIRYDIGWPTATVIPLGVDHIPDQGPKPWIPAPDLRRPLRVGTLMRLGTGEARYKGNELLPRLRDEVQRIGGTAVFEVMGRGTQSDAENLRQQGFTVHLNASDAQRAAFLRDVDVFVSPSKWEGTNLPLVEAQALGTPALAFDTGAHPEFTPLVFPALRLMAQQILAYERQREGLLVEHGRAGYHFVRSRLSWELAAHRMAVLIRQVDTGTPPARRPAASRLRITARRAGASLKRHGPARTAKHVALRIVPRRPGESSGGGDG